MIMPRDKHLASKEENVPLSLSQKRIWLLQNFYHDHVMYNVARCFNINGPLNGETLQETLQTLARRHEPLRSKLMQTPDGKIFQIFDKELQSKIECIDLQNLSPSETDVHAKQLIQDAVSRPFDIYREQMFRILWLKLGEKQSVLLFVKHHLITDYFSWNLFLKEFEEIYTAITNHRDICLPPLIFTYSDFAKKQQDLLQNDHLTRMHKYWKNFFEEHAPELLTDSASKQSEMTDIPSYESAREIIPPEIVTQCKTIAQQQKCTLFIVVLTSIALLASYVYRTSNVLLCFANANRRLHGTEHLVGCFFTNTIISVNLPPKRKIFELIDDVRKAVITSWQHQEIPFEIFAEDLALACTKEQRPPYRIYISYRKTPDDSEFNLPGTEVRPIDVSTGRNTHEDIVFNFWGKQSASETIVDVEWLWRTDLFDKNFIQKPFAMWNALLNEIHRGIDLDVENLKQKAAEHLARL
jgi:hypothetical protein